MATYDRIADLPLRVDDYALEWLSRDVSSGFTRVSTVIRLRGGGHEGVGEDVSYDEDDQRALQRAGTTQPLAGDWTLDSFSRHLATLDLWPEPARHEASVDYRVWAYESAALDLALRQAGRSLHELLGRTPRPLTFVVSYRLPDDPPTIDPLRRRLDDYPTLRFKLDPTSTWGDDLIAQLAATGAVDSVDFKSFYTGTIVDQEPDPDLYARVIAAFPDAWIEDPALTPETSPVLADHHDRITWDAPIHSVADIEALAFPPKMVNIKPSRFGALRNLFAAYDHCEAHGIGGYGGGQFELGPGRGHIQYLASVFHPDTPNDVAPTGYNAAELEPGLPSSPLAPRPSTIGFRWDDA
jgi:L-alanine-DL-glutamate epimerase-like enolase superfamily enzyme